MMRRLSLLLLVIVSSRAALAGAPAERLLARVPDDAALIVVVPSVEKLVSGIAAFGKSVGVDDLADLDAQGLVEGLGLVDEVEGLSIGGPLLLAMSPSRNEPLLMCLVKDAEVWRCAVDAEQSEGGLYRIPFCCDQGVAGFEGDVLILGEDGEAVREALGASGKYAERFRSDCGKLLETQQVVVHVQMEGWKPTIEAAATTFQTSMQVGMAMSGQHDEGSIRYVNWLVGQAREVLSQIEVFSAGARLGTEGVFVECGATFAGGGSVAGYLGKVHKTEGPLLRGLLDEASFFVFACEWELAPGTKSLGARYIEGLLGEAETLKERLEDEAFRKGFEATMAMQEEVSGYNVAIRTGADGKGIVFDGQYFTKQPQAMLENMRASYAIVPDMMGTFGGGATVEVGSRTEQVGSVEAQVCEMSFGGGDEQSQRVVEALYGKKLTTYAVPRGEGAVYAMGPPECARARVAKILSGQGKQLTGNERVVAAGKALSPKPQFCMLVDLPKAVEFGLGLARTMGAPVPPVELPKKPTALIAFGGYLEENKLWCELFVPAEPIKALIEAFGVVGGPAEGEY